MAAISVVDLTNISTKNGRQPSEENWTTVAAEIEQALSTIGFVYLINHDVEQHKISRAFETSKQFFGLPQVVKQKYLKDTSKTFHGYSSPGQELLNPYSSHEVRESYNFVGNDKHLYNINDFPELYSANIELKDECASLIKKLLKILAISLELEDKEFFIKRSKNIDDESIKALSTFRTIYYPPIGDDVLPNTVRCSDHTDYGTLTLLFQDEVGGLEVRTVDDNWIPATPIPGSILVNTGDLLEFWSSGHFPATHHRVLIPETELKKRVSRQSIVYFHHPDSCTTVTPLTTKMAKDLGTFSNLTINAGDHGISKLNTTYKY